MKKKNLLRILLILFFIQVVLGVQSCRSHSTPAESPPQQEIASDSDGQIEIAVMEALAERTTMDVAQGMVSYQAADIQVSPDRRWSTAWILVYDPALDMYLPSEPGLAILQWDGTAWQVTLPGESGWDRMLQSLPDDLLTRDEKDMWSAMNQGEVVEAVEAAPDTGYKLPWLGGLTGYLSRSVAHDEDYTTAHYSFDFFFLGTTICPTTASLGIASPTGTNGYNFDLHASKAGTVWTFDDSVVDCNHEDVNFIVLRNNDNPANFQLYLHLSQDSIPDELKHVGAPVAQGQFIGRADNTGNSTGSHLHFQLQGQPYWPSDNPYWAVARDMVFSDVNIYGGHPRREWEVDAEYCLGSDGDYVCDEYGRMTYVSANYPSGDSTPPTGGLSGITLGQVVETQTLTVSGWGDDGGSGLDRMQLTAFYNNAWHDIGSPFTADFTYAWNLCDPNTTIPDGLESVALNIYDQAGNVLWLAGLSHFTKNYACPLPPPPCLPGPEQVTLFEAADYTAGCFIYSIGNYATANALAPLGNDDAASILVGSNVIATLYSEENYLGHSQTLISADNNLADNYVPADRLSSLRVWLRSDLPAAPLPVSPASGIQFKQNDLISISWRNGGGAVEYQVQLTTPTTIMTMPWQAQPYLPLSGLTQGAYSWKVRGRSLAGDGPWSTTQGFGVGFPEARPDAQIAPFTDNMETSGALWGDIGIWSLQPGEGVNGSYAWWYQDADANYATGATNYGWLTSPPVSIPDTDYYLRFYYRYQTETYTTVWDQRWVQISVNGGPFENYYQLSEDAQTQETTSWLQSPPLSLNAYSGKTIQVRFYFHTLDEALNGYLGWGIDDFSITNSSPAACTDLRLDDTPAQATPLAYNDSFAMQGEVCPNGDWDYYKFSGGSGDRVVVDINAMSAGSLLDPYIYLLDSDGLTLLAENDDEIYAVRRDSMLSFTLPHAGTYYIKVRAWKHPAVGGQDYFYTLRLYEDQADPVVSFNWPQTGAVLPDAVFNVVASVADANDGVHRVEFYWHNQEWQTGVWELVGTDWDGSDGWSAAFDPAGQPEGQGAAINATAFDRAGNSTSQAVWNLIIDKTAPTSAMLPMIPSQFSTAFLISWTGSDNLSGIATLELQQSLNGGAWQDYGQLDGSLTSWWLVGAAGNSYQYRMHAIDFAGNTEDYPTSAETSTAIPASSTLCSSRDAYDSGTNDNSPDIAPIVDVNAPARTHNFCNPLESDFLFDKDWIGFPVQAGMTYFIEATALAPQSAVLLSLVASDGTSLIAEAAPDIFGERTMLTWTSDRDGIVYVEMQHLDGRVIGSVVAYQVQVRAGYGIYLPILHKK
jgi:hypothetical protein